MDCALYQVDAFASRPFSGNPAAVMPMAEFPHDSLMQALAAENNLAETAFLVGGEGQYQLRWFTPTAEVPLCGHATLASAAVVMERLEPGRTSVAFETLSGTLHVRRDGSAYVLDLPAYDPQQVPVPAGLHAALGIAVAQFYSYPGHFLAAVDFPETLRGMAPDFSRLAAIDCLGVVVTAPGDNGHDFVSRFFAPALGVNEDPVTGSAHCALVPFWSRLTGKTAFRAYQASPRGGEIGCRLVGDRVQLSGEAVFYLEGRVSV